MIATSATSQNWKKRSPGIWCIILENGNGIDKFHTKMSITKILILNDGKNISSEEQVVNIDIDTL
jgi:predicted RNase H-like nuclease